MSSRRYRPSRSRTKLSTRDGSAWGRTLSPLLASLVVHHWSGSGLGLRTLGGLRLLSQADALRRLRLQESSRRQLSLVVGCRRGSLPGLTMTSVVGALVSHLLHHTQPWEKLGGDVLVTGVRRPGRIHILTSWGRQWNLLLGTSYRRWVRVARNCTSRGLPGLRDPVP